VKFSGSHDACRHCYKPSDGSAKNDGCDAWQLAGYDAGSINDCIALAGSNALAEPLAVTIGNPLAGSNALAEPLAQSMIASRWLAQIHLVTAVSRTMFGNERWLVVMATGW